MRICARCPVRPECLRDAFETYPTFEAWGVWGGTDRALRMRLTGRNYPTGDDHDRQRYLAGLYGSSFRFTVGADNFDAKPGRSDYNPDGLPERTIREAKVAEFGPVTFPAYQGATAGVRSLTD
jgi:Caudovirus prohead protease./Transcription factor WhiB.